MAKEIAYEKDLRIADVRERLIMGEPKVRIVKYLVEKYDISKAQGYLDVKRAELIRKRWNHQRKPREEAMTEVEQLYMDALRLAKKLEDTTEMRKVTERLEELWDVKERTEIEVSGKGKIQINIGGESWEE